MTVVVVWGLNFPATKILRNELSTLQVLGLRWPAFAALLLVVTLIVEKRRRVSGRDFLALALIAVPGIVLNQMMWVHGLGATTASRAALI
ncbi:MAG: DMT family transporter, partial [Armatimonadota bacterium]